MRLTLITASIFIFSVASSLSYGMGGRRVVETELEYTSDENSQGQHWTWKIGISLNNSETNYFSSELNAEEADKKLDIAITGAKELLAAEARAILDRKLEEQRRSFPNEHVQGWSAAVGEPEIISASISPQPESMGLFPYFTQVKLYHRYSITVFYSKGDQTPSDPGYE